MVCGRCGGFLVVENGCNEMTEGSNPSIPSTRCVNCGNLEDPMIRMNRTLGLLFARPVRNVKAFSEVRSNQ